MAILQGFVLISAFIVCITPNSPNNKPPNLEQFPIDTSPQIKTFTFPQ